VGNACPTALEDVVTDEPFFYPNPVQHILYLRLSGDNNRVIMTNLLGQVVFDAKGTYSLDMTPYAAGIYSVLVENERGTIRGKVMKK
jgi:selenophosphate synthetase-related protein